MVTTLDSVILFSVYVVYASYGAEVLAILKGIKGRSNFVNQGLAKPTECCYIKLGNHMDLGSVTIKNCLVTNVIGFLKISAM